MYWASFFHFYQPAHQQPDILEAIVAQSYRPFLESLKMSKARITLNINGVLLELFDKHGHRDLIDILRDVGKDGRLEFTGSAKYHAFLPFLKREEEIIRQIKANNETNKFFLGDAYHPQGFFPPEMGYKPELAPLIESQGFKWIILDEIACTGEPNQVDYTKLYRIKDTSLNIFFRERRLSNLIMSAVVRSKKSLLEAMKDDLKANRYIVTGMDGETFGHHRPGLEQMLSEIFNAKEFNLVTISELPKHYQETIEVKPVASTWASSKLDIDKNIQFLSWSDPENVIHKWQWELTDLALQNVESIDKDNPAYEEIRKKMDAALSSDHFWWASAKPWWSLEMIEAGAHHLLEIIRQIPNIPKEKLQQAADYYEKIISTAFEWQRTGKIRTMLREQYESYRIPFKDRTWGLGSTGGAVYVAFTKMIKKLEKEAAEKGEYEKAIIWRDAIWQMEHKTDIYEAVNAIDLLRTELPNEDVEKVINKYRDAYLKLRGGQPEQRGS